MSVTPTGASPGLGGGANGEIEQKDNVIGADSTLESTKLEPLKPQAQAGDVTADKQVSQVLDGLADSQPAKTAGDLINQAASESRRGHPEAGLETVCSCRSALNLVDLANQAYAAVVGKK
jgi:hypothetical protein